MLVHVFPDRVAHICKCGVVEDGPAAIASRTCRMIIFVPHRFSSMHSSHFRYAVSLAQGSGAKGPSMIRMTLPRVIYSGACARAYPPPLPFLLSRIPFPRSWRRITSRNFFGICSACNRRDHHRPVPVFARQIVERPQSILGLFRQSLQCDPSNRSFHQPAGRGECASRANVRSTSVYAREGDRAF